MSKRIQPHQFYIIPLVILTIDRILKILALNGVTAKNSIFNFILLKNTGVSWGLFQGNNIALLFLSIAIVGAIIFFYKELAVQKLATHFILIGAISNIIDRITFGFIVDYIDFGFFPVFNLADACISLGGIVLIIYFLFNLNTENNKKK